MGTVPERHPQAIKAMKKMFKDIEITLRCPICWEMSSDPVKTACNHEFCRRCVERSLKKSATCPVCQEPTSKRNIRSLPDKQGLIEQCRLTLLAFMEDIGDAQDTIPSHHTHATTQVHTGRAIPTTTPSKENGNTSGSPERDRPSTDSVGLHDSKRRRVSSPSCALEVLEVSGDVMIV